MGGGHCLDRRVVLRGTAGLAGSIALPVRTRAAEFADWLVDFRTRAARAGVDQLTLDRALRGLTPNARVLQLDQRQSTGKPNFGAYLARVVSQQRIQAGARRLAENSLVLQRVRERFGVTASVVVALWGVESAFGSFTGDFAVVNSLATLAWEGRRRELFERELLSALSILQRSGIAPERLTGSWAGAMGQCQFMPSTYLAYAVDFDRDGRADIWSSVSDVLGSIANYLASAGWDGSFIWGREVRAPRQGDDAIEGLDRQLTLIEWQARGIRRTDGGPLPAEPIRASLIRTDDGSGPAYLVYDNFRTLMVWNRSTYFALSVGILADEIATAVSS